MRLQCSDAASAAINRSQLADVRHVCAFSNCNTPMPDISHCCRILTLGEQNINYIQRGIIDADVSSYRDETGKWAWIPANITLCWLLQQLPVPLKCVELCAGSAIPSTFLHNNGHDVIATDAFAEALKSAEENYQANGISCAQRGGIRLLRCGDTEATVQLLAEWGQADVVLSSECCWHRGYDPALSIYQQALAVCCTAAELLRPASSTTNTSPSTSTRQAQERPLFVMVYTERSAGMCACVERACRAAGLACAHIDPACSLPCVASLPAAHTGQTPRGATEACRPLPWMQQVLHDWAHIDLSAMDAGMAAACPAEDLRVLIAGRRQEDVAGFVTSRAAGLRLLAWPEDDEGDLGGMAGGDGSNPSSIAPVQPVARARGGQGRQGGDMTTNNPLWAPGRAAAS